MSSYKDYVEAQKNSINNANSFSDLYESLSSHKKHCKCHHHEEKDCQTHTHEFTASTKLAEENDDRHNHRFAGITSEVIPIRNGSHKHALFTLTDFFGHLHQVAVETGPAVNVCDGKHVHFVEGVTTIDDGHFHEFAFATLIDAPLLPL
jgi:hypothetical protein